MTGRTCASALKVGMLLAVFATLSGGSTSQCVLTGIVMDSTGGRIVGASVTVTGISGGRQETVTNQSGAYSLPVVPGKYELRVARSGFCAGIRGGFIVGEQRSVHLDFQLIPCGIADGFKQRHIAGTSEPFSRSIGGYEAEYLPVDSRTGLKPLILFGSRERTGSKFVYGGLPAAGDGFPVVLTFNLLTIRCTTLSYDPRTRDIVGSGSVLVQDGSVTNAGARVTLRLAGFAPKVALVR